MKTAIETKTEWETASSFSKMDSWHSAEYAKLFYEAKRKARDSQAPAQPTEEVPHAHHPVEVPVKFYSFGNATF